MGERDDPRVARGGGAAPAEAADRADDMGEDDTGADDTGDARCAHRGGKPGRRWVRWNGKLKAAFLDHLAATCNVKAAALAIGVDPASVYHLRRSDPAFVAAWGEALALGYEMLETQLVGHALAGGGGGRIVANGAATLGRDERPIGPIDVDLALRMLAHHAAGRGPRKGGPVRRVADRADTDAAILRQLRRYAAGAPCGAASAPVLVEHLPAPTEDEA